MSTIPINLNNVGQHFYCSPIFIAMSGMIGVGKTHFADYLEQEYKIKAYHEMDLNEKKLAQFYSDKKRYAFSLQIALLAQRSLLQDSIPLYESAVLDRTPYEDSVFAFMLNKIGFISDDDYDTYMRISHVVYTKMRKPTVIIHLDIPPEVAMERIKNRGRDMESNITLEYLTQLYNAYETFLLEISKQIPVIRIDWSRFPDEFTQGPKATVDEILKKLGDTLSNLTGIHIISP